MSPWILGLGCVFICAYIIWSIIVVNRYFEQKYIIQKRNAQLKYFADAITDIRKDLYRAKQRIALLEGRPVPEKSPAPKPPEPQAKVEAPEKAPAQATERVQATDKEIGKDKQGVQGKPGLNQQAPLEQKARQAATAEKVTDNRPVVEVKNPSMRITKDRVKISFKLVNLVQGIEPLRGYVHIILIDNSSIPPKRWSARNVKLTDGMPVNFKEGQLFSIKRFRIIHGSSPLDSGPGIPTSMRVLVFDKSGKMIFDHEFELKRPEEAKT